MEFYRNSFGEEMDKEKFMSLQSLIKNNDGLWKSEKQGNFFSKKWTEDEDFVKDSWITTFEIAKAGMKYIIVDGFNSFGHGGGRGHRPITYLYEIDHAGIVARYRTRHTGDINKGGTSLKSVEEDWRRTETPEAPQTSQEAPEAPKKVSEYVGNAGDKLKQIELPLVFTTGYDTDFGYCVIHKFEDEAGNVLIWKTTSRALEAGKKYRFNATIKEHKEYNDTKQTILTRLTKIEQI